MINFKKMGGAIAILASTLNLSSPSFALNSTIANTTAGQSVDGTDLGQSFINDPNGSGTTIKLNSWVFNFNNSSDSATYSNSTLSIFFGTGNGGTLIGSSTTTSVASVSGFSDPVTWTFAGGLDITDTSTYTAVLVGGVLGLKRSASASNPYSNGVATSGTNQESFDLGFRGNFSLVPVPFEFNPAMGLTILGVGFAVRKQFAKKISLRAK